LAISNHHPSALYIRTTSTAKTSCKERINIPKDTTSPVQTASKSISSVSSSCSNDSIVLSCRSHLLLVILHCKHLNQWTNTKLSSNIPLKNSRQPKDNDSIPKKLNGQMMHNKENIINHKMNKNEQSIKLLCILLLLLILLLKSLPLVLQIP